MKKLLVFMLFLGSTASAGRIDEIVIMTEESLQQTLALTDPGVSYKIISQEFTPASSATGLAVKSELVVSNQGRNSTQQWTCVTQFVKTPTFFEVLETKCK